MRVILAAAILIAPMLGAATAAHAAELSEKTLSGYRASCVKSCIEKHPQATCRTACQCMSDEMKAHWTQEKYNGYATVLTDRKKDNRQTRQMVQQMAAYCFQKATRR